MPPLQKAMVQSRLQMRLSKRPGLRSTQQRRVVDELQWDELPEPQEAKV